MLSDLITFILPVLGAGVIYLCLMGALLGTQDKEEPPLAQWSIPFLQPLGQLLVRRHAVWLYMGRSCNRPIFTVRLPGVRCYVVNDGSLVQAVDRQIKTLSFAPVEAKATAGTMGMTDVTSEIMRRDPAGSNGHFTTFHQAVRPHLSPGSGLDEMTRKSIRKIENELWQIQQTTTRRLPFFEWVRHTILLATTEGEYGPGNPFQDPAFENAWFKFVPGVPFLASGILPQIFSRRSYLAREFLAESFEEYFRGNHHLEGSAALLARLRHGISTGIPDSDRARGEVGYCMALVNNTVPATFWLLYHICSDPDLLHQCREELSKACRVDEQGAQSIDLACVRTSCPVLNSVLLEVFRYYGIGTVLVRQVIDDYRLDNTYLLKKGSIVLMPNISQHYSQNIWGSDVHKFNPRRFHSMKRQNNTDLRIFGGGALLCPGRHFANNVILGFAAHVLLRFDIEPTVKHGHGGKAVWQKLEMERSLGLGVAKVFMLPRGDLDVKITPKQGVETRTVRLS